MIIDLILDRYDRERGGNFRYNAHDFYIEVMRYGGSYADEITRAMDSGSEDDTRRALSVYIRGNQYNENIIQYINARKWNENTNQRREYIPI